MGAEMRLSRKAKILSVAACVVLGCDSCPALTVGMLSSGMYIHICVYVYAYVIYIHKHIYIYTYI